jgi:hypothetical protein
MESKLTAIYVIGVLKLPIIAIGLMGSFLSFLVFSRKAFREYSIGIYCRALALSDSFILYRFVFDLLNYLNNTKISYKSEFLCKLNFYIQVGLSPISIWIVVAFSIDKMLNTHESSNKFAFMAKKKFQLAFVSSIAIFRALFYIFVPVLVSLKPVPGSNETSFVCLLQNAPNYKYFSCFFLIESSILPFVIMIIATSVIINRLVKSRHNLEKITKKSLNYRKRKDVKFGITSIALNALSVVLLIPVTLSYIVTFENQIDSSLFVTIGTFLFYLNYSITFFVHLTFNRVFRNEFLMMLRLRKQKITPIIPNANNNRAI